VLLLKTDIALFDRDQHDEREVTLTSVTPQCVAREQYYLLIYVTAQQVEKQMN
jgi:hypothetical protein